MSAFVDSAKGTALALVRTVEQAAVAAENTTKALNTAIETTNSTLKLVDTTVKSVEKNVGSVGNATSSAIDNSSQVANSALQTLNDKLKLTNEITNTVMNLTHDFIKTASKSATDVGNSTVNVIQFGALIVSALTSIISYPFERLKQKINEIKKTNDKVETKITQLQKIDIQNFEYTKKSILIGFKNGVNSYMTLIKIAMKSLKEFGCEPGYINYRCNEDITIKLKMINILINDNIRTRNALNDEITTIFNEYTIQIREFEHNLVGDDDNQKIENWEKKVTGVKSRIINTAIAKYTRLIDDKFNHTLKLINAHVITIKSSIEKNIIKPVISADTPVISEDTPVISADTPVNSEYKSVYTPVTHITELVETTPIQNSPADDIVRNIPLPPQSIQDTPPTESGGSSGAKRATKSKRSKKSKSKRSIKSKTKRVKRRE